MVRAAVLFGVAAAACLAGLAIAVLPLNLSLAFAILLIGGLVLAVAAVSPPMRRIPERSLLLGLCLCVGLYFLWPRNVFLPIPALPIKHPQRLVHLCLLLWAMVVLAKCAPARERVSERLRAIPWVTTAWVVFWVWMGLSAVTSRAPLAAWSSWLLDVLIVAAMYPLALLALKSQREVRLLVLALVGAACLNAAFAMVESVRQRNLFESVSSLHLVDPEMAKLVVDAKIRGGKYRAQAAFDHPLLFAEYMVVCLPFVLVSLLVRGRGRLLSFLAAIAVVAGLTLAHSRVVLAASLIMGLVLAVLLILRGAAAGRRNPWPLVLTLLALPIALLFGFFATDVLGNLAQGRSADEANSSGARVTMLVQGLQVLAESPLLGYGAGQGALALNFRNTFGLLTLDNFLLVVALDAGVPALLAFLLCTVAAIATSFRLAVVHDLQTSAWPLAVPAAIAAFLAIKLVLGTNLNNLLLGLLLALTAISAAEAKRHKTRKYLP
jgi:hypothetical protein